MRDWDPGPRIPRLGPPRRAKSMEMQYAEGFHVVSARVG